MKKLLLIVFSLCTFFAVKASDTTNVTAVLAIGETVKSDSLLVLDKVTSNPITASVTGVSIQNSNPAAATVSYINRVVTISRVGAGSGTATLSCRVTYTDPGDGLQKSEDKVVLINYTVAGEPHGINISLFN